jgi:hypothetical protein
LTKIDQVSFENAVKNCEIIEFENMKLPVIGLKDLMLSKIKSERLKDKADFEALQEIKRVTGK